MWLRVDSSCRALPCIVLECCTRVFTNASSNEFCNLGSCILALPFALSLAVHYGIVLARVLGTIAQYMPLAKSPYTESHPATSKVSLLLVAPTYSLPLARTWCHCPCKVLATGKATLHC